MELSKTGHFGGPQINTGAYYLHPCPQAFFSSVFWHFWGKKNAKTHSKGTVWGTPRQVPKRHSKSTHERSFSSSEISPRNFVGPEKKMIPKFTPTFPQNVPPKNQKNSPTSFCRSAGRTLSTNFRTVTKTHFDPLQSEPFAIGPVQFS